MPKRKEELIEEEEDDAYSKRTKYKESSRDERMRQREDATKLQEEAASAAIAAAIPPPLVTGREQPSKESAKNKDNEDGGVTIESLAKSDEDAKAALKSSESMGDNQPGEESLGSVKDSKGTTATDDGTTAAAMKEPANKRVAPPRKQLSTTAAKKSEVDKEVNVEKMREQCAKALRDVIIKYHMSGGVANNLPA